MGNDSSYFQYFSVALGAATYLRVRHLKWRRLDATRSFEDLRVLKGLEELLSGVSCKFKEPDPSLIGLVSDLLCMGQESFCRVWTCSRHIRSRFLFNRARLGSATVLICAALSCFFCFMWIKYCISGILPCFSKSTTGLLNHWARLCSSLSSDLLTLTQCFILPNWRPFRRRSDSQLVTSFWITWPASKWEASDPGEQTRDLVNEQTFRLISFGRVVRVIRLTWGKRSRSLRKWLEFAKHLVECSLVEIVSKREGLMGAAYCVAVELFRNSMK